MFRAVRRGSWPPADRILNWADWPAEIACSPLPNSIRAIMLVRHRSTICPNAVPHTFARSRGLSRTRSFSAIIVPFGRSVPQRVREPPDVAGEIAVVARRYQAHVQQVVDPAGIPGLAGEPSYQLLEVGSILADGLLALGRDGLDELLDGAVCLRSRSLWARRREPLGTPVGHLLHHLAPP